VVGRGCPTACGRAFDTPRDERASVSVLMMAGMFATGCASRHVTNTPRSAIEQLLLSGAVDRALEKFSLPELSGKKLFVDFTNLKA